MLHNKASLYSLCINAFYCNTCLTVQDMGIYRANSILFIFPEKWYMSQWLTFSITHQYIPSSITYAATMYPLQVSIIQSVIYDTVHLLLNYYYRKFVFFSHRSDWAPTSDACDRNLARTNIFLWEQAWPWLPWSSKCSYSGIITKPCNFRRPFTKLTQISRSQRRQALHTEEV